VKLAEFDDPLNAHIKVRTQLGKLGLTELASIAVYDQRPREPVTHLVATDAGILTVVVPVSAGAEPTATLTRWSEVGGAGIVTEGFAGSPMTMTGRLGNPPYEGHAVGADSVGAKALDDFIRLCMKYEGSWAPRPEAGPGSDTVT
jgi:hypothetical protein